jgi:hypothetical protein
MVYIRTMGTGWTPDLSALRSWRSTPKFSALTYHRQDQTSKGKKFAFSYCLPSPVETLLLAPLSVFFIVLRETARNDTVESLDLGESHLGFLARTLCRFRLYPDDLHEGPDHSK